MNEDIKVVVSADIDKFNSNMQQVEGKIKGLGSSMSRVSTVGVKALGAITTALGAVATAVGVAGVKFDALMEQSKIAWTSILQDEQKATDTLAKLVEMGKKTPFEFAGLDKSAKLLDMAGFHGKELFKTLTSVGDAVSAIGGGDEALEGVSMAIFQMASKSKISAQEMNQLAERGIPAWQMIADGMGLSVKQVMKMGEDGKLFAKEVLPLLVDGLGKRFEGSMEKQSKTFNGRLSTMKDSLKILAGKLSEPLFDGLKHGMETMQPALDRLTAWADGGFKGFDGIKNSLGALVDYMKGDTIGANILLLKLGLSTETIKIMNNVVGTIRDTISTFVTWTKGAFGALTAFIKGDIIGADIILLKLGLSPETVKMINTAVDNIKMAITGFVDGLVSYYKGIFNGEGNVGESFVRIFNVIKDIALPILQDAVNFIKEKLAVLREFWDENGAQIIQAVKNFWSIIASIFEFIAPVLLFIVEFIWDSVKGVIDGALKIIMGIIKVFAGLFTGDFGKMWEGIKDIFWGALEFLWNLVNLMLVGDIIKAIKGFGTLTIDFFKAFGRDIGTFFKELWQAMWKFVDDFAKGAVDAFKWFRDMGFGVWDSFRGLLEVIWHSIYSNVMGKVTALKDGAITLFEGMKSVVSGIFETLKGLITNPIETAKNIILGIIDTIKNAFNALKIKIPDFKLPHVSVTMKKGLAGIPYPDFDVDWFAKGGLFNSASVIGVGERGAEAVVPLQGHRMQPFAETIAKQMPANNSASGLIVNVASLIVREEADIKRVATELFNLQQRTLRQGGRA